MWAKGSDQSTTGLFSYAPFLFYKGAASTRSSFELAEDGASCSLKTSVQVQHHPAAEGTWQLTGMARAGAGGCLLRAQERTLGGQREEEVSRNAPGHCQLDPRPYPGKDKLYQPQDTRAPNVSGTPGTGFTHASLCLPTVLWSTIIPISQREKPKEQRGKVTCPRACSCKWQNQDLNPVSVVPESMSLTIRVNCFSEHIKNHWRALGGTRGHRP